MVTDDQIDAAVDKYIRLLEEGHFAAAQAAEEEAADLIERKRWEDDGL
jgi:hypothetical protein